MPLTELGGNGTGEGELCCGFMSVQSWREVRQVQVNGTHPGQRWRSGKPQRGEKEQSYGQKAEVVLSQSTSKNNQVPRCAAGRGDGGRETDSRPTQQDAQWQSSPIPGHEGHPLHPALLHELSLSIPRRSPACEQQQGSHCLIPVARERKPLPAGPGADLLRKVVTGQPVPSACGREGWKSFHSLHTPGCPSLLPSSCRSKHCDPCSPSTAEKKGQKSIFPLPR